MIIAAIPDHVAGCTLDRRLKAGDDKRGCAGNNINREKKE